MSTRLALDVEGGVDAEVDVERPIAVSGQRQDAGPLTFFENAACQPTDQLQAFLVYVEQNELVDRQAVSMSTEALHQLWGIGAAAADHRDLQAHVERSYAKGS